MYNTHTASGFGLKDSCITKVSKDYRIIFGAKSFASIYIRQFASLVNYPVFCGSIYVYMILIYNMVPLNAIFHVMQSIYNFFAFLSISGNMQKFAIFNIILWLKVSRKIQN